MEMVESSLQDIVDMTIYPWYKRNYRYIVLLQNNIYMFHHPRTKVMHNVRRMLDTLLPELQFDAQEGKKLPLTAN